MSLITVHQCDRCRAKSNPVEDDELPEGWVARTLPTALGETEEMELCGDCDRKLIEFVVVRRSAPTVLTCELCPEAEFRSRQQLAAHRRQRHSATLGKAAAPVPVTKRLLDGPTAPSSPSESIARFKLGKIDSRGPVLGCEDCEFVTHGAVSMNAHTSEAHNRRAKQAERTPLSGDHKAERLTAVGIEPPA